ncbi:hypothetical protein P6U16_03605 [Rhizobium sp. 32-5/1]|uniref:hypothetical protein n=1 Tax=Rhizobium sp. 32-5/1 TaxID=3019602 RepID=UPI00240E8013|nr:hypothetical protein [Rhizobium sp. 32-5/1]WEZ83862.1 hypothetical protein P6U16_03605 [Rhizobium sp. 32-5/1]
MGMTITELLELDREGELSTLTPVADDVLKSIAAQYPGISKQYLAFIRAVGTGSTKTGSYIYEPEPAASVEQNQSFQIYNGVPYQKLSKWFSGKEPKRDRIPADAIWLQTLLPLGDIAFAPPSATAFSVSIWLVRHSKLIPRTSSRLSQEA